MAMLAWALGRERRSRGLGELAALHQLGHAEKRKSRASEQSSMCTNARRYSSIVDGLTHQINHSMPVYVSFARDARLHGVHGAVCGMSHSRRKTPAAGRWCTK